MSILHRVNWKHQLTKLGWLEGVPAYIHALLRRTMLPASYNSTTLYLASMPPCSDVRTTTGTKNASTRFASLDASVLSVERAL